MAQAADTTGGPDDAVTFACEPGTRIRVSIFRGTVTDDRLVAAYHRLLHSPDYDPSLHDLVDLRGVERLEVSSIGFWGLTGMLQEVDRLGIRTRLAIVAPSDVAYGLSRMYELLREGDPGCTEEIRLFREIDEARNWLLEAG